MADTMARPSGPANIGSGTSTLFTVTTNHTYTIRSGGILIVNNTTAPITYKLGIGGVTDALLIMPAIAVPGGGAISWPPENSYVVLLTGETLQVNASATGGTGTVSLVDQV